MPKGGARKASDIYPVGKGMGLDRHHALFLLIKNKKQINAKEAIIELNQKYAWWDDPDASGPTETCRSYLKELWRLGLLDRISKTTKRIIPISPKNWVGGEQPSTYKLSKLGDFILSKNSNLFAYYVGWCVINAYKNNIYPQFEKLLKLYDVTGHIPVSDDKTAELTKANNITVEKHGGKAIKFGWLEPTGIIYRKDKDSFALNKRVFDCLNKKPIEKLFNGINCRELLEEGIKIKLLDEEIGLTNFHKDTIYNFRIQLENLTDQKKIIKIEPKLFSIFEYISEIKIDNSLLTIKPKTKQVINLALISNAVGISDSLMNTCIGAINIEFDNSVKASLLLPSILIKNKDHIWELKLCGMLRKLDLRIFHLTGKSDRPDAVIDLSGLKKPPSDLLYYLRDGNKEKLLMETTLGEYTGNKLSADTIGKNLRGYTKFQTHSNFVLKIASIGQLIVADYFSQDIINKYTQIKKIAKHTISLIDKKNLEYMISKFDKDKHKSKLIKLLKSNEIINKELIDKSLNK